jgi:cell division protein FtsQ
MNIFDINLIQLKNRLLKNTWIKDVTIKRIIPNKIVIDIVENNPVFILQKNNKFYYIDKCGNVISEIKKDKIISLPILVLNKVQDAKELYNMLDLNILPVSKNTLGWIMLDPFYVKLFDYKKRVMWILDKDSLKESAYNGRLIWKHLVNLKEDFKVQQITVIGNTGWLKYKQ